MDQARNTEPHGRHPSKSIIGCFLCNVGVNTNHYSVNIYEDEGDEFDGDCGACTLENYKNLANAGALCVFNHGSTDYTYPIGFDSPEACNAWINGEQGMVAYEVAEDQWRVKVDTNWLNQNWEEQLDENHAFVFWASCYSATIMNYAGGCVSFGYSTTVTDFTAGQQIQTLLHRMEGGYPDVTKRSAGAAFNAGGLGSALTMSGGGWSTLYPTPIAVSACWPDSDPGLRTGWGCLIFDTYMDISSPPGSALVCENGGPISNVQWCGDTGYGKYVLGFNYDNTGGGASLRAVADYCTDEGGKPMDGDRETPNGDDYSWQY